MNNEFEVHLEVHSVIKLDFTNVIIHHDYVTDKYYFQFVKGDDRIRGPYDTFKDVIPAIGLAAKDWIPF